jgi:phospholipase D3/4
MTSQGCICKIVTIHLLAANWTNSPDSAEKYLKDLLYTNVLCSSSIYNNCGCKIEIQRYIVPGYDMTGPVIVNVTATDNFYPGYFRDNHDKYAVSDVWAHIDTSNLIWDYFYSTMGSVLEVGTYNTSIVKQVQQVFDADWNSPFTQPVQPLSAQA